MRCWNVTTNFGVDIARFVGIQELGTQECTELPQRWRS